jgi:hypothetical protein
VGDELMVHSLCEFQALKHVMLRLFAICRLGLVVCLFGNAGDLTASVESLETELKAGITHILTKQSKMMGVLSSMAIKMVNSIP